MANEPEPSLLRSAPRTPPVSAPISATRGRDVGASRSMVGRWKMQGLLVPKWSKILLILRYTSNKNTQITLIIKEQVLYNMLQADWMFLGMVPANLFKDVLRILKVYIRVKKHNSFVRFFHPEAESAEARRSWVAGGCWSSSERGRLEILAPYPT